LHDAIPAHCFERSVLRSFSYVAMDLLGVATLAYCATYIGEAPFWARFLLWPLYWACQVIFFPLALSTFCASVIFVLFHRYSKGVVMTGVWVLAHECGHQAFSDYKWLNDAVGLVLHSALLVPYHGWRITHGAHHKNTNHQDRDQVFVPSTRSQVREAVLDSPLVNLYEIMVTLLFGWPAYLIVNIAGQDYGRRTNHFEPSSPLFKPKDRRDIIVSNFGLLVVLALLTAFVYQTSFATMVCFYGVPYLIVNFFLVTITYLQHTVSDLSKLHKITMNMISVFF
jgi:omega-6 fatty acid desaturase (delta-12 desaturase)